MASLNISEPFCTYNEYIKTRFKERVQKITVLSGLTCPNRDGTKGFGGCAYCNNQSFAAPEKIAHLSITKQIEHGIKVSKRRYKNVSKYIIYFQSYSNTYGDLNYLKKIFEEALVYPDVVGISIGTRADCFTPEIYNLLAELNEKTFLTVELGLESANDQTLARMNRQTTVEEFILAARILKSLKIEICAHLIIGLPGDTLSDYLKAIKIINLEKVDSIKFHQLHIVKDTKLAQTYLEKPFTPLLRSEYLEILCKLICALNPHIAIARFLAECSPDELLSPPWEGDLNCFVNDLKGKMRELHMVQGRDTV